MITIRVHLFETLQACLPPESNRGQAQVQLPEGSTLADLIVYLGIDDHLGFPPEDVLGKAGWQAIVSGQFEADTLRVLREGDTVLMMPHLSGG